MAVKVTPMTRKNETITLLPAERLLRSMLLACRAELQAAGDPAAGDLRIWITGGWVRDRLLGIPSCDVDLALSSMTGSRLAEALTAYYRRNEDRLRVEALAAGVPPQHARCTDFHTTKKNPGKSKNLETAVGRIFGLDVDMVNLRREVYEADSRTPVMEFGTPEEDALRRDATVNALFFDVDAQKVVDLTRRGLDDMAAGIMRTPLPPRQTFLDDPLRVLRLVRMCSKLGYSLDPEAREWMSRGEIHAALTAKVSRERIGIEVFKMMRNRNPQAAMVLLWECGLWESVFVGLDAGVGKDLRKKLPPAAGEKDGRGGGGATPWPPTLPRAYELLALITEGGGGDVGRTLREEDAENRYLYWLAAAHSPLEPLGGSAHAKNAVDDATRALKLTSSQSRILAHSLQHVASIRSAVALVASHPDAPPPRSAVAVPIRCWGATWRIQLVFSLLAEAVYGKNDDDDDDDEDDDGRLFASILERYGSFAKFVSREQLGEAHAVKPVLDGKEILALYGVRGGGGAWLKRAIDELVAWKFDHPGQGVEEAKAWLEKERNRLGVPPEN